MTTRTLPTYRGPRCECGAARRPQHRTCRKCEAIARWMRRRRVTQRTVRRSRPGVAPAASRLRRGSRHGSSRRNGR